MTKTFFAAIIATLLLISGCNLDSEKNIQAAPSESLPAVVTPQEPVITETLAEEEEAITSVATENMLEGMEVTNFEYFDFYSKPASEEFLALLSSMSDEEFWECADGYNDFIFRDYLFSKGKIIPPTGKSDLIFYSSNGYSRMFWLNKTTIILQIVELWFLDGASPGYYQLDLTTGQILELELKAPSDYEHFSTTFDENFWYKGQRFFSTIAYMGEPGNQAVYIEKDSELELLVPSTLLKEINNDLFYYSPDEDSSALYSVDFSGQNVTKILEIDNPFLIVVTVKYDKVFVFNIAVNKKPYLINLETMDRFSFDYTYNSLQLTKDGMFYIDGENNLCFITNNGEISILKSDVNYEIIDGVIGDWLYWSTSENAIDTDDKYYYGPKIYHNFKTNIKTDETVSLD